MTRHYVSLNRFRSDIANESEASWEIWFLGVRDQIRAVLDPDGLHTNWVVSDIFKWSGKSSNPGYGFLIKHRDGGSPSTDTGHEWLFIFPRFNVEFEEIFGLEINATINTYFIDNEGNTSTFFTDDAPSYHYNNDNSTDTYDIGLDSEGTLIGGDFSSPNTNPWSDADIFMPQNRLIGTWWRDWDVAHFFSPWCIVADDEKPFLSIYMAQDQIREFSNVWIAGNLVVPYDSSDLNTAGVFSYTLDIGSSSLISNHELHYTYDALGNAISVTARYHTNFGLDNSPMSDGTFAWNTVTLETPTFYKGYIDSDIIRVMGAGGLRYCQLYDNGLFIKIHPQLTFPYAPNKPLFFDDNFDIL